MLVQVEKDKDKELVVLFQGGVQNEAQVAAVKGKSNRDGGY